MESHTKPTTTLQNFLKKRLLFPTRRENHSKGLAEEPKYKKSTHGFTPVYRHQSSSQVSEISIIGNFTRSWLEGRWLFKTSIRSICRMACRTFCNKAWDYPRCSNKGLYFTTLFQKVWFFRTKMAKSQELTARETCFGMTRMWGLMIKVGVSSGFLVVNRRADVIISNAKGDVEERELIVGDFV